MKGSSDQNAALFSVQQLNPFPWYKQTQLGLSWLELALVYEMKVQYAHAGTQGDKRTLFFRNIKAFLF